MQNLTLAGTVGRDAELRQTQGGDPVLSFSIAVDNGKDANGNKREATWFDCSIWGKRATALQGHITKGSKLTVTGRPTAREHNGKVYLGCSVNELTFMGGGNRDSQTQPQQSTPAGGYDPRDDLQDDVPF
jgi:single-strand DNA-binding protein